jgi:hypothetical protein
MEPMMNKRIEELAQQAGMLRDKYGLYWNAHVHDNPDDGVDLEKFAELIVRECSRVAKLEVGTDRVCDAIENHFGVQP